MNFVPERQWKSRKAPFLVSLGLHLTVLGAMMYKPEPQLLRPTSSVRGDGGSGPAIALVAPGVSTMAMPKGVAQEAEKKELVAPRKKRSSRLKQAKPEPQPPQAVANKGLKPGMPGFILGSVSAGIISDHDVRIALPVHAPDPPIVRAKLPEWIRGDVIVEVTISESGDVTEAIVLETVGYGLEETVVETLKKWRWIPATIDGIKVASKQDVRFHFPS